MILPARGLGKWTIVASSSQFSPLILPSLPTIIARDLVMSHQLVGPPTPTQQAQFAKYCLLSFVAVSVFQCKPSGDANALVTLIWGNTPFITSTAIHALNRIGCIKTRLSQQYTALVSLTLLGLGQFATWIPIYLAKECGTGRQVCAIHFALSYVILSECEYYRLSWETHNRNRPFNLKSVLAASQDAEMDLEFRERCDYVSYGFLEIPVLRPEDGWLCRRSFMDFIPHLVQAGIFYFASGCLNYFVKRLANPNLHGDNFPLGVEEYYHVFFTPRRWIYSLLDLLFQRPTRVLNGMLFWSIRRWVDRAWNGWCNRRTSLITRDQEIKTYTDVSSRQWSA